MSRASCTDAELGLYSYGRIAKGAKPNVCYIIDVSGLRDPQTNRGFRNNYKDGRAGEVQKYVAEDPRIEAIVDQVKLLAEMHLRGNGADKQWLTFGFRDHHGRWTSPAVCEIVADVMDRSGFKVHVSHANCEVSK